MPAWVIAVPATNIDSAAAKPPFFLDFPKKAASPMFSEGDEVAAMT
jgi:hypothetical protein